MGGALSARATQLQSARMDIGNIDRWLGISGLVVGLIGIWLAIRFYKKTIRSKL
jgi:hypothetical protein